MNNFRKIFASLILIGAFVSVGSASAKNEVDVEYSNGSNLNRGKLFSAERILPGWSQNSLIRVENDSKTSDVDLYIKFDVERGELLAKALKLYVIQKDNGRYRIGGEGDRFTLKEAYEKGELFVDRLSSEKGKDYKVKIVFDENAGNEYQGLSTEFDIDFTIESRKASKSTPEQILASQNRIMSTEIATPEELAEEETALGMGSVGVGANEFAEKHFSWWWLLLLLLLLLLAYYLWKKYKKYKEEKERDEKKKKNKIK